MLGCRPERTQFSLHPPVRAQFPTWTPPLEWESRARSCLQLWAAFAPADGPCSCRRGPLAPARGQRAASVRPGRIGRFVALQTSRSHPSLAERTCLDRRLAWRSITRHPSRPRLRTLPTPGGSMGGANQTRPKCHGTKLSCQNFRYLVFLKNFTFSLEITKKTIIDPKKTSKVVMTYTVFRYKPY